MANFRDHLKASMFIEVFRDHLKASTGIRSKHFDIDARFLKIITRVCHRW